MTTAATSAHTAAGVDELNDTVTGAVDSAVSLLELLARGALIVSAIGIAVGVVMLVSGSSRAVGTILGSVTGVVLATVGLSGGIDWIIGHASLAGVGT